MHLTKHHGLGNDFLVTFVATVPEEASMLARALCDRREGVGADGLIFAIDEGSTTAMRLFNSDGSAAEISGNGMRCFLQAIAMRRGVQTLEVDVDTLAGIRRGSLETTSDPAVAHAAVEMGPVGAGDAPGADDFLENIDGLKAARRWAVGDVGNPHVVIDIADPHLVDLAHVGPKIESNFPRGVNAHMVTASGTDELTLFVWERGAGITQACGSGATVAAQRFNDWGVVGNRVQVKMPGGTATVEVPDAPHLSAVLHGPTTFVAAVEVPHG